MADADSRMVHLLFNRDVYTKVQHAAVDEHTNASEWIRDAVARKLGDVPEDERLAALCGAWAAMGDECRDHLLWLAQALADSPTTQKTRG